MVRKALKRLWTLRCDILISEKAVNQQNGITESTEKVLSTDNPCFLCVESAPSVSESDLAPGVSQSITLFCDRALSVPSGSVVRVTRDGVTTRYCCAGVPSVYSNHKEIALVLEQRWA